VAAAHRGWPAPSAWSCNVGLNRADVSDWHWTYFYDDDFCFSRLSFPHMFAPSNAPDGMGSIQAEVYFSDKYKAADGHAGRMDRASHHRSAAMRAHQEQRPDRDDVRRSTFAMRTSSSTWNEPPRWQPVNAYLDDLGIQRCGRYGDWGYLWTGRVVHER
jgi:hypothetical protein